MVQATGMAWHGMARRVAWVGLPSYSRLCLVEIVCRRSVVQSFTTTHFRHRSSMMGDHRVGKLDRLGMLALTPAGS